LTDGLSKPSAQIDTPKKPFEQMKGEWFCDRRQQAVVCIPNARELCNEPVTRPLPFSEISARRCQ
jgi:hypothetical protein